MRGVAMTPYTLYPAPCTLHLIPCTLHLHPTPYTLHPAPCTLHPTPCNLHPSPYTLAVGEDQMDSGRCDDEGGAREVEDGLVRMHPREREREPILHL